LRHYPAVLANVGKNGYEAFDVIVSQAAKALNEARELQDSNKYQRDLSEFFEDLINLSQTQYGICCFAGDISNILMWSHYADSRKGIALCFDSSIRLFKKTSGISHHQVDYSIDRDIDILSEGWSNSYIRLFTRKSIDWAYEKESRYISHVGPGLLPYKEQALRGIGLWCRFGDNLSESITREIVGRLFVTILAENKMRPKGHKLHVYQAFKKPGEFNIVLKRLDDVRDLWRLYPV